MIYFIILFVCATARLTDTEAQDVGLKTPTIIHKEHEELRDPGCLPTDLVVELPITKDIVYKLSITHARVRRCIGVNNENKACVSIDQVIKMEHWNVVKQISGSDEKEFIHVSWVSHEKCKYKTRKCPIDKARECHEKRTTHYYDEDNCNCTFIVQIGGNFSLVLDTEAKVTTTTRTTELPLTTGALVTSAYTINDEGTVESKMAMSTNTNDISSETMKAQDTTSTSADHCVTLGVPLLLSVVALVVLGINYFRLRRDIVNLQMCRHSDDTLSTSTMLLENNNFQEDEGRVVVKRMVSRDKSLPYTNDVRFNADCSLQYNQSRQLEDCSHPLQER